MSNRTIELSNRQVEFLNNEAKELGTNVSELIRRILDSHISEKLCWWPEVFDTKDISSRTDAELLVDALIAWGHCHSGCMHTNFGEVMAAIARRIHVLGTPESFQEKGRNFLAGDRNGKDKNSTESKLY